MTLNHDYDPVVIANMSPDHVPKLALLQKLAFPNLHDDELLKEHHYLNHLRLFPEGQFTALDSSKNHEPVGATSTFRVHFDFDRPDHKFFEVIDHGWFGNHTPDGEWLYGGDVNVHPNYRGRGIARKLYQARLGLVTRLNLRGQLAGGMIPGYYRYADSLTISQYVAKVISGELSDPTLSVQLRMGFKVLHILHEHLQDPTSGNAAAFIRWRNPDYTETGIQGVDWRLRDVQRHHGPGEEILEKVEVRINDQRAR